MGDPFKIPSPAAVAAWDATHKPSLTREPARERVRPRGDSPKGFVSPHSEDRSDRASEPRQPRARWGLAQAASKAGWQVQILHRPSFRDGDGPGWMLILSNPQHCIHVEYIRSTDVRFPDRVWRLVNRSLTTRCPHGDRVAIGDLREWLRKHPVDCEERGGNTVLAELPYMRRSCRDRHPHPQRWDGPIYGGEVPDAAS